MYEMGVLIVFWEQPDNAAKKIMIQSCLIKCLALYIIKIPFFN